MDPWMDGWMLSLSRALQNFETAVRENVTINGQPWEEASDESRLQSGRRRVPSLPAGWVGLVWFGWVRLGLVWCYPEVKGGRLEGEVLT